MSLDDKEEEKYVRNIMESKGIKVFHTWPRPAPGKDLQKVGFVCEYKLGNYAIVFCLYIYIVLFQYFVYAKSNSFLVYVCQCHS